MRFGLVPQQELAKRMMVIVSTSEGVLSSHRAEPGSEDEVQERCLLHVAASRGRDTLTITSHGRPSGFVEESK